MVRVKNMNYLKLSILVKKVKDISLTVITVKLSHKDRERERFLLA